MSGVEGVWLDLIRHTKPETVLDIGCRDLRSTRAIADLIGEGYRGVDVDAEAIARAGDSRCFAVGRKDFGLSLGMQFDMILLSCVVYHLTNDLVTLLFMALPELLTKDGIAWLNVNTVIPEASWNGLPFVRRSVGFYKGLAEFNQLRLNDVGCLSDWGYTLSRSTASNRLLIVRRKV